MKRKRPIVLLTIQDRGNRFSILGSCRKAARKAGWSNDEIVRFCQRAISGDHDNLIRLCYENFEMH